MPSPITAQALVEGGMRALTVLAVGETMSAAELTDGLRALNDVVETWNIEGLSIYGSLPETFSTVAGQGTYTIGVGGNWNTTRPVQISGAYCTVSGVDFPVGLWTLAEWMDEPVKSQQQQIIERLVYVNDFPLGQVILWPTPSSVITVTLDSPQAIIQAVDGTTVFTLAPGYARALQYAVAVELAPQYGAADVSAYAKATKAAIKRANRFTPVAQFDPALLGGARAIPSRGY